MRQLFEGALADKKTRAAALKGAAAPAEAAFGPPGEEAASPPRDASFTTLHGLYWLALNLAEQQPLVLAIDDLHWCDRASLCFIAYLAGRLEGQPILVATTLRSTDPGVDPALVADVAHSPATRAIRPGPLSGDAVAELVRERLGPNAEPAFCAACHTATGGNPLLLGQLLTALESDGVKPDGASAGAVRDIGPRAVSRGVLLRLARLPEPAVEVARAVAVVGDGADLATITAFTGLDEATVAASSGDLARAEILAPRHAAGLRPSAGARRRVRGALAGRARAPARPRRGGDGRRRSRRRARGRAPAADGQARRPGGGGPRWWKRPAPPSPRGRPRARWRTCAGPWTSPRRAEQRPQLLLELGTAEALASGAEAVEHLQAAYEQLEDPAQRIAAAPVLAESLIFRGRAGEAAAFAREAARHVPEEMAAMREVLEGIELGTTMFGVSEPDMVRRLAEYRDRPVGPGPGDKMLAAMTAWEWALTGGGADECVELARQSLTDDSVVVAENGFLTVPAITVMAMADLDEAAERWDRLVAQTQASGSHFAVSCAHLWSGITQTRRGELAEAEALLRTGRDELSMWGPLPVDGAYFSGTIPLVLLERGDVEGARRELGERPPASTTTTTPATSGCAATPRSCWPRARTRRRSSARRSSARWSAGWSTPPGCPGARSRPSPWTGSAAPTRRSPGRRRSWSTRAAGARPGTVGRSLRVLGTLRRAEGLELLDEAVALLERSPARLELAKALAAQGATLRRERKPTDARDPLRRALELAELCDAGGLAAEVRTELYATGSRPRSNAMTGPEALTASEKRVAELAAEGLTNRDIAQTLFVTPKTVEVHLSATYRKLGIRSRRELAGVVRGGLSRGRGVAWAERPREQRLRCTILDLSVARDGGDACWSGSTASSTWPGVGAVENVLDRMSAPPPLARVVFDLRELAFLDLAGLQTILRADARGRDERVRGRGGPPARHREPGVHAHPRRRDADHGRPAAG